MTDEQKKTPAEPEPKEFHPRPGPPVVKCPNCEEEKLTFSKTRHRWECLECGYVQNDF